MFRLEDLPLYDEPHCGWLQVLDDEALKVAIEVDNSQSCGEFA